MKYKVNSIFYSIIGEGCWTGTAATFIRLAGCNKHCRFCDTDHEENMVATEQNIVDMVEKYPSKVVVITGGEPLMQNIRSLMIELIAREFHVHIETNGTLDPVAPSIPCWLTVSPKGRKLNPTLLMEASEVKILCGTQNWKTLVRGVEAYIRPSCRKWIMPLDTIGLKDFNTETAVDFVKKHPDWSLCVQVHKYIGVE